MAVYRLHRKQWERGYAVVPIHVQRKVRTKEGPHDGDPPVREVSVRQRSNRAEGDNEDALEKPHSNPSETHVGRSMQRKGVSSGLSTVVRHRSTITGGVDGTKGKWWTVLTGTGGSKGKIRVSV